MPSAESRQSQNPRGCPNSAKLVAIFALKHQMSAKLVLELIVPAFELLKLLIG